MMQRNEAQCPEAQFNDASVGDNAENHFALAMVVGTVVVVLLPSVLSVFPCFLLQGLPHAMMVGQLGRNSLFLSFMAMMLKSISTGS
jgi:hypothetical protein